MLRSAFKRNRCTIPASGNFEWKTMPDGKHPYFISAGTLKLSVIRSRKRCHFFGIVRLRNFRMADLKSWKVS